MDFPQHSVHIYQKPAVGSAFIQSLPVYNYRHSINARGWFDAASFDIAIPSIADRQRFLDLYLGNRIAIFVDNPCEPAWEGLINRMSFNAGGTQYSISIDQMANRVAIQYASGGAVVTTETTVSNDTNSQALYGIKQDTVDTGPQLSAGTGITTAFRGTIIAQRAWPKTSRIPSGGGSGLLHVECLGFFHTLEWEEFRDANNALNALNTAITAVLLPAVANGTTFFDNADTTDIAANASTLNRNSQRGEKIWNRLLTIAEIGDGTNYYVIGITPTFFGTGKRRLYYRQANSAIEYTARQADGMQVRDLYGNLVKPWKVKPDRGIRINDMLIGWNGVGDNPMESYILKIDYDANAQTAIFSGDDDLTAEGVFNLKQYNQAMGNKPKQFGTSRRLV